MKLSSLAFLVPFAVSLAACGDDTTGSASGTGGGSGGGSSSGDTSAPSSSSSSSSSSTGPGSSGSGGDPTGSGGDTGAGGNGGDTGAGGNGGDTGAGGNGGDTGAGGAPACDNDGFTAVAEDSGPAFGYFNYLAQSTLDTPFDALKFELLSDEGETGPREITDADYSTCDTCVLVYTACDDDFVCDKTFLANTGTLDVETFDETFSGVLRDAVLVEVTIDDDLVSTPVEGGETWCIGEYEFSAINQGLEG